MLRTIDRYVIREVIPPFFLSLVIFTFILEIPPVMRDLETLVAKGVPWQAAGRIILTLIPQALGLTIPMALLTGLLIGLGRLSADREAVALLACGVSPYRLLRPVLFLALVAAGRHRVRDAQGHPGRQPDVPGNHLRRDRARRSRTTSGRGCSSRTFRAGSSTCATRRTPAAGWRDVLVANTSKPDATELYLAERGRLVLSRAGAPGRSDPRPNGTRYSTGKPGETQTGTWTKDLTMALNPEDVFRRAELPRGINEKTIAELRKDGETKLQGRALAAPGNLFTSSRSSRSRSAASCSRSSASRWA